MSADLVIPLDTCPLPERRTLGWIFDRDQKGRSFLLVKQIIFNVVSRNESMEKGGWKVALAEIVEGVLRDDRSFVRKCESKLRHTRCVWNGSDCKSALLGPNHARLSTKLSRSQQNLRNRGATRGGGVAARCVETTSCSRTKKLVDGGGEGIRDEREGSRIIFF